MTRVSLIGSVLIWALAPAVVTAQNGTDDIASDAPIGDGTDAAEDDGTDTTRADGADDRVPAADASETDRGLPEADAEAAPTPAPGSAEDQARQQFGRGIELYREGNYTAALFAFKEAYRNSPNHRLFYNIGVSHLALHDYASAFIMLERYLEAGGDEVPEDRRESVQQEIDLIRPRIGQVYISTNVPGAEIAIDGVVLGASPLGSPQLVNIGQREITASARGWHSTRHTVDVIGSDVHRVTLDLDRVPMVQTTVETDSPGAWEGPAFWTTATLAVALAGSAVVTGVLANSADGDLSSALNTFPADPVEVADARDRVDTMALATDILTGAAILAAGTAITVAVLWANTGDDEEESEVAELRLTPLGMNLTSRF